jgi:hypothetical protein
VGAEKRRKRRRRRRLKTKGKGIKGHRNKTQEREETGT